MPRKIEGIDRVAKHLINQVAKDTGLTEEEVYNIYESQFAFAREKIQAINFDEIKTEEDMSNSRNSFNFPRLLKLYPSFYTLTNLRKRLDDKRKRSEEIES